LAIGAVADTTIDKSGGSPLLGAMGTMASEPLDLESFRRALESLERSLDVLQQTKSGKYAEVSEVIQSGVIQNFEATYEMAWKAMRRRLIAIQGSVNIERFSRRELFRQAARADLIGDAEAWMHFHDQRNNLSHRYGGEMMENALQIAKEFAGAAHKLLGELESCP
jgi:nucleotidyltransferase substrate binding protein (TIGR01987 family)